MVKIWIEDNKLNIEDDKVWRVISLDKLDGWDEIKRVHNLDSLKEKLDSLPSMNPIIDLLEWIKQLEEGNDPLLCKLWKNYRTHKMSKLYYL